MYVPYIFLLHVFLCCSESPESRGVMVAQHVCGELGADGRGSTGLGTVHMRDKANGLESRRLGWPVRSRRVVRTRGCCNGAGCTCRAG